MKVLIVEDEKSLAEEMAHYLTLQGFLCDHASSVAEASESVHLYAYDVIILDLMLPDGDGLGLLPEVKARRAETGIIVLTARDSVDDKITGLDRGADDYLTKPFHLSELNSRIHALLRRSIAHGSDAIVCGRLRVDPRSMAALAGDQALDLTPREFHLLLYFLVNRNRVLSRQAIAEHLLGEQADAADSYDFVYVHINNLRRKLASAGIPDLIRTRYGSGYQLVSP